MSLMSEIQALRAEIRAQATGPATTAGNASAESVTIGPPPDMSARTDDVDTFLKAINETLDEFADELDRFPRLTALAALGIGVVIGRHLR